MSKSHFQFVNRTWLRYDQMKLKIEIKSQLAGHNMDGGVLPNILKRDNISMIQPEVTLFRSHPPACPGHMLSTNFLKDGQLFLRNTRMPLSQTPGH